ncbi:MAG: UDP-N-acetylmuramoyl-L-alanyl-D-glutamate--2,6-diaminopimelate ligase [Bacteroidales bacterium]|nr:UDP-N-acetylmuramoyl-L-alanyl-D-glutamate--2,6-diaminopimelate ligase [Bacteroidales bacterium]MDD6751068.1 UDP-N-acetylmuramoyl-L-alanyl-D-glutamate--2,6-diaminopimelate ligase [Bacteroidales bacterium]
MILSELIKDLDCISINGGNTGCEVKGVTNDTREAGQGWAFVAVTGCGNDGRQYIGRAIEAGACAIIGEGLDTYMEACSDSVCWIEVEDSRLAVATVADRFYDHPSGKLKLVGITGTNGKTTTVTLLYNLFRSLGYKCGLLSTIANYVGDKRLETANTTSDPVTINRLLNEMQECGCSYCFMEVSSIGIEQKRISGLEFAAGLFSNLTHDHLDYHGTFAEYLRCKKLFFDNLGSDAIAIVNVDDRNGRVMVQNCAARTVTTSCRSLADHSCRIIEESFDGMLLRIDGVEMWTRLIGAHNAYNLLAAYSLAVEFGYTPEDILTALSALGAAPGRLEVMHGPKELSVVIDYAHTPDALENVLHTLKDIEPGKPLICLFGCGGDRDRSKRPEMAAVAQKWADRIIVTSDNSRSENTADIIKEICTGLDDKGRAKTICIEDRKEAIRAAITFADKGSTILLAGKGHETYQILGKEKLHFDEREIVNDVFKTIS